MIPVSRINPAPYNPRLDLKPGDPEYEKLRRSVEEFGLVEPLVWNVRTGNLVGGHQRFKVLVARGDTRAQVSEVDLDPARERALNLALNKISGGWDQTKLAQLLDELCATPDFDVGITGFEPLEVQDLLERAGLREFREEFDVEAELERAARGPEVTRPGEIVRLGDHRLLCGDCTDPELVKKLVESGGGERAVLFATDPPYLVNYDGTNHPVSRQRRLEARQKRTKADGNKDWSGSYGVTWDDADAQSGLYERFIAAAVAEAIRPDAAWYCWHASRRQAMLERAWESHGAFVHAQIIWVKNRSVLTRSWYGWQHEPCFMGWMKPPLGKKPPRREPLVRSSVWQFDTLASGPERPDHPTPKPLELFEIPIRQHTRAGEVVYEPFAGSGTQLIAAQRLGRRCLAIEVSPRYCDLIVRRWIACVGASLAPRELVKRYVKDQDALSREAKGATRIATPQAEASPSGAKTKNPSSREQAALSSGTQRGSKSSMTTPKTKRVSATKSPKPAPTSSRKRGGR